MTKQIKHKRFMRDRKFKKRGSSYKAGGKLVWRDKSGDIHYHRDVVEKDSSDKKLLIKGEIMKPEDWVKFRMLMYNANIEELKYMGVLISKEIRWALEEKLMGVHN